MMSRLVVRNCVWRLTTARVSAAGSCAGSHITTRCSQLSASFSTAFPRPQSSRSNSFPVRHSRKQPPRVCTDEQQLVDLTAEIFEAPAGSLFKYTEHRGGAQQPTIEQDREQAWIVADAVVQTADFVARGWAARLHGTRTQHWMEAPPTTNIPPERIVASLEVLVLRLWQEGQVYMKLRDERLEELYGPKPPPFPAKDEEEEGDGENVKSDYLEGDIDGELDRFGDTDGELDRFVHDLLESDDEEGESGYKKREMDGKEDRSVQGLLESDYIEGESDYIEGDSDYNEGEIDRFQLPWGSLDEDSTRLPEEMTKEQEEQTYMDDFALPGPTVAMYDMVLDAMACCPPSEPLLGKACHMYQQIISRHVLDGNDDNNTMEFTRPTVLSHNAPIRVAAVQDYDAQSSLRTSKVRLRDLAVGTAFDCFSRAAPRRSSATYTYLLQTVAKYFPPSRIRGNVATGIWHHAAEEGLMAPAVCEAAAAAHMPSNGPEFKVPVWNPQEFPQKWTRHSRVRRYDIRDETY